MSVEDRQADGTLTYPYGPDPVGLLVYDASGYMSVMIMRRDRAAFSTDDWQRVPAEEIKSAVGDVTAFFGPYEVDEENRTIVHHVIGHVLPNSVGKKLRRSFEFSGDRLILKPSETREVIWERLELADHTAVVSPDRNKCQESQA